MVTLSAFRSVLRPGFVAGGLLLLATSCASGPGDEDFTASLREARPGMTEDEAQCMVDELQRSYSDDDLVSLTTDAASMSAEELDRFASDQLDAVRACELDDQVAAELVAAFAAANDVSPDVAECVVSSLQDQIGFWELTDVLAAPDRELRFQRRQFEAIFVCGDRSRVIDQLEPQLVEQGVADSDATCVAEEIAATMEVDDLGVLYSGRMTDRFYGLYFDALEACDALPA